jgi:phosphopantothenoylcysteine decarboxylase/phosphopantothenate--cysteine ligase
MNCVVTAGPTYESLDEVRRLTNFSTGRLGTELAGYLSAHGHDVTLLIGELATYRGERQARKVETFTTTKDLHARLKKLSGEAPDGVFHAAAVSDFTFGKVWRRAEGGGLDEVKSGKISTGAGTLLAELVPTPKIIAELRGWFPRARLTGWKYEVEGGRAGVIALGEQQMAKCLTDACVVNGRAYGDGFGLLAGGKCLHLADAAALFEALEQTLRK